MTKKRKHRRTVVPLSRGRPKYDLTQSPDPGPPQLSLADAKAVARLVGVYDRPTIAAAADRVVQRARGRPKLGSAAPAVAPLSADDTKKLARLVGKYGREFIAAAAKAIVRRGAGRPSRGRLPDYEKMHLADWINEVAEEHRVRGSRYPERDAALELHELIFGGVAVRDEWLKTTKNKRLLGEKLYRELAKGIKEHPEQAKALGISLKGLPSWLKSKK